jgi:hypothetical protein
VAGEKSYFFHQVFARENNSTECAALAVDVLGRRMDYDVGAKVGGFLQNRCAEAVVDIQ